MFNSSTEAVCRGCGLVLKGKPYSQGGHAYHPRTGKLCPSNYFGGFVCSPECDYASSLELERDMPTHGYKQTSIGQDALESYKYNWRDL